MIYILFNALTLEYIEKWLKQYAFILLSPNEWLCISIIDIYLPTYARHLGIIKTTNILTQNQVRQLMYTKEIGETFDKTITFKLNRMIIVPWLLIGENHSIIALINLNTSVYYIIDPYKSYDNESCISKGCFV